MLWSSVRVDRALLADALGQRDPHRSLDDLREQVEREVRFANITIIEGNDASQFGIGVTCARITEAILDDERAVMPAAAYHERYGVTIGLPTIVGRRGSARGAAPRLGLVGCQRRPPALADTLVRRLGVRRRSSRVTA
jgi:L-lactate dehydrogenase